MALKIIKSNDPIKIEQLVVVVYGSPGLGKSTLGFTADSPILLDFDKGAYRAAVRGDSVPVESWTDVTGITAEDLNGYNTVVVDTAGRALDFLTADIIRRNAKLGRGGALTLQGYGALKSEFTAWLKMVKLLGKDVVLIAHSSEEKNGDDLLERLDVQGGSKGEIYKSADAMGRLTLVNGKRVLNFSPTDAAFGKNPGNLNPLSVPDIGTDQNFLAGVIQTIKDRLNSLTEEQAERQKVINEYLARIKKADTVDNLNLLVGEVVDLDGGVKKIVGGALHKTAEAKGYSFDSKKKLYVAKEAEAAA